MVFNIVIGVIMGGCFIGMIICAKKQHVNALAKPAAIVLLLGVVICTVMILMRNMSDGDTAGLIANELKFAKASSYILAKKIAEIKPGAKVLVIIAEENENNKRQKVILDGLTEGFGSAITQVAVKAPTIKGLKGQKREEMMMPITEMIKADDINKLILKNKARNFIISLIGLPMDMGNLKIWSQFAEDPKKAPRISIMNGDISMLYKPIKQGLIPAVVTHNPDAVYSEDAAPSDMQEAFNKRYILITTKNVDEIKKKYGDKVFRTKK